jgi:hypothetical protein
MFLNHYTPIVWLSICGCCKDVATSLLAYIWPKACYWAWFYTCVISPRFTPMYPRGWIHRLALKLYWNMSNHWRWPNYNEIDSLLFYKFSFNQSFSWNQHYKCFSCLVFLSFFVFSFFLFFMLFPYPNHKFNIWWINNENYAKFVHS